MLLAQPASPARCRSRPSFSGSSLRCWWWRSQCGRGLNPGCGRCGECAAGTLRGCRSLAAERASPRAASYPLTLPLDLSCSAPSQYSKPRRAVHDFITEQPYWGGVFMAVILWCHIFLTFPLSFLSHSSAISLPLLSRFSRTLTFLTFSLSFPSHFSQFLLAFLSHFSRVFAQLRAHARLQRSSHQGGGPSFSPAFSHPFSLFSVAFPHTLC